MEITPEMYLSEEQMGTAEERQDYQFEQTARNLSNRKEYTAADSFDEFTGSPTLDLEVELQQVQAELHRTTNSLKQIQLSKKAEELAAAIVGQQAEQEGKELSEEEMDNSVQELLSVYGQETVDRTLQWAATGVSEEIAEAANEVLAQGGEDSIQVFNALKEVSELPEASVDRGGVPEAFDLGLANQLAEEYGAAGEDIAAINAALVAGQCTKEQAIRHCMSNPRTLFAAMDAAKRGLIRIGV